MTNGSGLYEYTDKVTVLTMITRPEFYTAGEWTVERITELIAQHPELRLPSGQDRLVTLFSWAATAEFMDQNDMTCRFDSAEFISWLRLLKALPAEEAERSEDPLLFDITHDLASSAGYGARSSLKSEYAAAGFPNASGSGSYFMKLGSSDGSGIGRLSGGMFTIGCNTSIGMMSSGRNRDGAWRFIRTFITGETEPSLSQGIPVLRESFERALEAEVRKQEAADSRGFDFAFFNEQDADALRELVYGISRSVHPDASVMDTLKEQINAYLGGKGSAEETAKQIQSRLSLYMSEQYS